MIFFDVLSYNILNKYRIQMKYILERKQVEDDPYITFEITMHFWYNEWFYAKIFAYQIDASGIAINMQIIKSNKRGSIIQAATN